MISGEAVLIMQDDPKGRALCNCIYCGKELESVYFCLRKKAGRDFPVRSFAALHNGSIGKWFSVKVLGQNRMGDGEEGRYLEAVLSTQASVV